MNNVKVYLVHSIRGIAGTKATSEIMEANSQKAIEFVRSLEVAFPNVDFYCPAEHDEFVLNAWEKGLISENDILDVDCQILSKRHILLVYAYDQYISNGMLREIKHAQLLGIPVFFATNIVDASEVLNKELHRMLVG